MTSTCTRSSRALFSATVFAACLWSASAHADFDAYIKRPEPKYKWSVHSESSKDGLEIVRLDMTSQTWRGRDWTHRVWLYRATKTKHKDLGLMVVSGGRAKTQKRLSAELVAASGGTVIILDSIPNQPLWNLREDALIAHTFLQYHKSGEKDWPLLFPMAKSAVKAMDTVVAYSKKKWGQEINRFIVSGASKRGWTTWLTAAVDKRVVGIVPIVYDNLNLRAQMKKQLDTWGKYSFKIKDYTERNLQKFFNTPRGRDLSRWVDPYTYRERFKTLPKLIVNATNDHYWTLDSLNAYWDDIGIHKNVLYVPNQRHGIRDFDRVLNSAGAFARAIGQKKHLPQLNWSYSRAGKQTQITLKPSAVPTETRVWVTRSESMDFRKAKWEKQVLEQGQDGGSSYTIADPKKGFRAFFIEAKYKDSEGSYTLSTQIRIVGKKPKRSKLY